MLTLALFLSLAQPAPRGFIDGRLRGERTQLRDALEKFRGKNIESAHAWTWSTRAIILTQFPLSSVYHVDDGIRLSTMPWRHLACLQPGNLPEEASLQAIAREASFLVVTQAPDGKECVVNLIRGVEVVSKFDFVAQQERAETVPCSDVKARAAAFGAGSDVVNQLAAVLRKPLPWNPAFDQAPEGHRDGGS